MAQITIQADVIRQSEPLDPARTAVSAIRDIKLLEKLAKRLDKQKFTYKHRSTGQPEGNTNRRRNRLQPIVLRQIGNALHPSKGELWKWFPYVNDSEPVGPLWESRPGWDYVHPMIQNEILSAVYEEDGAMVYAYMNIRMKLPDGQA